MLLETPDYSDETVMGVTKQAMAEIGEESAWSVILAGKEMLDEQGITEQLWLRRLHVLREMAGKFPPWASFPRDCR